MIKNGRVINPGTGEDRIRDLYIVDGMISDRPATGNGDKASVIDASNCWIIPGIVDMAARFREPGHEHKGNIESESAAALAGGITSVCLQPDTLPVIDTPAVVELIEQRGSLARSPHLYTLGAMSIGLQGKQLSEFAALHEAGCLGVSNANNYISDTQFMRNIMDYATSHQLKVYLTPLDQSLSEGGCAHEGRVATRLGLPAIPEAAETVALTRDLTLVEVTGCEAHVCRLSAARSVDLVHNARQRGLSISADVSAHQLFLTDVDIGSFDSNTHVRPPLRTGEDRDRLRAGIQEGVIEAICSDHQPHDADAKLAPFGDTEPGIAGLDTLLPLTLKLIQDGVLDTLTGIRAITAGPAGILGIDAGTLNTGAPADICIVNPDVEWVYDVHSSPGQGRNTPFHGWSFQGRVTHTLVNGVLVYSP